MTKFEKTCYGMTEQDIRTDYMQGITARFSGLEMVVMGILSDAQETIQNEGARKQLNVAKFILSEMMKARMENEVKLDETVLDNGDLLLTPVNQHVYVK